MGNITAVLWQTELLSIVYFVLMLLFGVLLGRILLLKLYSGQVNRQRQRVHLGFSVLFLLIAVLYMLTGSQFIPAWIGKNIIFLCGYYLGLIKWHSLK